MDLHVPFRTPDPGAARARRGDPRGRRAATRRLPSTASPLVSTPIPFTSPPNRPRCAACRPSSRRQRCWRSGASVTHDGFGVPLLLARDARGTVRVFLNVCRHRGTRLVENDDVSTVAAPRLSVSCVELCPRRPADRRAAPRDFCRDLMATGLDRRDRGLVELPSCEAGGLVWVGLERTSPTMTSPSPRGPLAADFDALGLRRPAPLPPPDPPCRGELEADHGRLPRKLSRYPPPRRDDRADVPGRGDGGRPHRPPCAVGGCTRREA